MASFLKRVKRAVELLQRVSPLIWEYIFMLYEEMPREVPWRNPSCYKKEVRIYFDNTIVVCWNHKGRGNLLDFFSELIYPMLLCTHISTVYLIGLKEWRLFCYTQSLDQAKFTNVIPEALFLLSLLLVILLPSRVSMYCVAHNVCKSPILSHLNFSILAFSTNIWYGNTLGFLKLAKMYHFWPFLATFVNSKCKRSSLRSQC